MLMRRSILALALVAPVLGHAATWEADPPHSSVAFAVRHMMISTVHGQFRTFTATAIGDPAEPEKATSEATIDVGSVDTGNGKRVCHVCPQSPKIGSCLPR